MHPLRKRKNRSDGACTQYGTKADEGSSSGFKNIAESKLAKKESIVISDSDSSEPEEGGTSQKQKAFHRRTLAVKRKIARMTEEEQLALAVKISQQEQAHHVKHRQEEDELLRKAIEESLHNCSSPDKSADDTVHDLTMEALSNEEDVALDEQHKEHMSQHSQIVGQDSPQNPKVLLKRLSQDIVESPSVILSPNCQDPLSYTESCNAILSQSNSIDFDYVSPPKAALSPVIPVKSPYARKIKPCRLFQERSPSAVTLSDQIEGLQCSGSTQLDSSSLVPNSNTPELSEGASSSNNVGICLKGSSIGNASVNNMDVLPKRTYQKSTSKLANKMQNDSSVHYYWGIPFCPNGEDPNAYTQVILCQLEVYEKSLKKSQRQLLRKTEYGEPVDLSASSENNERAKYNQDNLSQEDTEEMIEGGEQQKLQQNEMEPADETDGSDIQPVPSKRLKASCSHFQEDDYSCPSEGQMRSPSQELSTNLLPSECEGVAPEVLVESPILPAIIRDENCPNSEMPIENTQEESILPETQLSSEIQDDDQEILKSHFIVIDSGCSQARSIALDDARGSQITEAPKKESEDQPSIAEESTSAKNQNFSLSERLPDVMVCEEPECSDVECPMCGCRFSPNQIEHHAAYCDGVKDESQKTVLRPRNRQSRQTHNGLHDSSASSNSSKLEYCFLCKSEVLLKDYLTHVDTCLQSAASETPGNRRLKSNKETAEREGRLLSMLEQSESISADENNSAFIDMSPPREEHAGSFGASHLSITDSPIRSFVSISEATDCLVDFKKQFSRPPKLQLNKRGTKYRGKRRRM